MCIEKLLKTLQDDLALIDLLNRTSSNKPYIELLILKKNNIKIKMYQEGHTRPHIHVDIGKENHVASYAIDRGGKTHF